MKNLLLILGLFTFSVQAQTVAWTKLIVLPETQVSVNYWRDSLLHYDINKGEVILYVDGYVSQKAYLAGAKPITTKQYLIPDSVNPQLGFAGKAFLTGYVMSQPEFEGSRVSQ